MKHKNKKKKCWQIMKKGVWYTSNYLAKYCNLTALEIGHFMRRLRDMGFVKKEIRYVKLYVRRYTKKSHWCKVNEIDFDVIVQLIEKGSVSDIDEIKVN